MHPYLQFEHEADVVHLRAGDDVLRSAIDLFQEVCAIVKFAISNFTARAAILEMHDR